MTTIKPSHKSCSYCRKVLHLSRFYRDKTRLDGRGRICKPCAKEYRIKNFNRDREKQSEKDKAYKRTLSGKFTNLKTTAAWRGIDMKLTKEQYKSLTKAGKCYYCKDTLPEASYGLDRKNPKIGYTVRNSVPCCTICNRMKTVLNYSEFINHLKRILRVHK